MRVIDFILDARTTSERLYARGADQASPDALAAMTLKTMIRPELVAYLLDDLGPEVRSPQDQLAGATLRMAEIVHWNLPAAVVGLRLGAGRMRAASFILPAHATTYLLDADPLAPDRKGRPALAEADLFAGALARVAFLGRFCSTPQMLDQTSSFLIDAPCCAASAGLLLAPSAWLAAASHKWREHPRLAYEGAVLGGEQALGCVYLSHRALDRERA